MNWDRSGGIPNRRSLNASAEHSQSMPTIRLSPTIIVELIGTDNVYGKTS